MPTFSRPTKAEIIVEVSTLEFRLIELSYFFFVRETSGFEDIICVEEDRVDSGKLLAHLSDADDHKLPS